MNASDHKNLGSSHVVITGEMTIYTAREWRDELLAALAAPGDVELDLSGVSDIDAAGIQLLVSLRLEAADGDRGFRVRAASKRVLEAFEFCRLLRFFELEPAAQA
ncbi:anti-sigma factor antagonist [Zoogloea oryzae]|uniref:Anti-sigma factor antagonist n=1 Tax=Zoogloea oryzae TaxID=310767 RepID=A0ABQ6F8S5_9RHOO|nr:STAS domain-containing protein [Zoogloea oryzae]GLT21240.1 anti-sigma factor antagonist [Zoogloea oryzae]